LDIRRQLDVVRRYLPLLLGSLVLAGAAAYVTTKAIPPTYDASTVLIVGQSQSTGTTDYNQLLVSQRLSQLYAELATTGPVLDAVRTKLGIPMTPEELQKDVSASAAKETNLVTVTAQANDPDLAVRIADTTAEEIVAKSHALQGNPTAYQTFLQEELKAIQSEIEDLKPQVDRLTALNNRTAAQEAQLQTLSTRLTDLRDAFAATLQYTTASAANAVAIVAPARLPNRPASPSLPLNLALSLIVALVIALAIAFVLDHLDDSVKTPEDVLALTGLATLGSILTMPGGRERPEVYRLQALLYPRSPGAERFRALRTNVEFASVDTPIRKLLVTSSAVGEGKTTVAANLAIVFAQAGRRTILVDADLRRPGVARMFDLPEGDGLSTMLRTDQWSIDEVAAQTEEPNLRVITTGPLPPNPSELLGSQRMRALLAQLDEEADLVIIDSPPLQAVTDAAILSSLVDGSILVIQANKTRTAVVRLGRESLAKVGAHILGAVLNRVVGQRADAYDVYGAAEHADERVRSGQVTAATRGARQAPHN
jgi:polysaccharide biosynthesis transport protein